MKISHMLSNGRPLFSFEFYPPKDDAGVESLMDVAAHLQDLKPDYISVTYGAGGSTRSRTLDLVGRIKRELGIETMAHLTCVGHSRREIRDILKDLAGRGIENVLALRGDPPKGDTSFKPHPDGFRYACELAADIAATDQFCFGVAGYPEKHPEAVSLEEDLVHLKQKVDTGASFVITQLFFYNEHYFSFVNRARALGIHCPIIPGIMPVTNYAQIKRFSMLSGAQLPLSLLESLETVQTDPEAVTQTGIRYAAQQCQELLQKGAPGIHFYTLNKSRATQEILEHLRGLREPSAPLLRDI